MTSADMASMAIRIGVCDTIPIPLSRVLKVETTSYEDAETENVVAARHPPAAPWRRSLRPNNSKREGVRIGCRQFYSVPVNQEHHCYEPWLPAGRRWRYRYETYEDYLADARYL